MNGNQATGIKMQRVHAMPNKNTFSIKPIAALLMDEVLPDKLWIDPFANSSKIAKITNDLNPLYDTDYNLDAVEFMQLFDDCSVDGVLYDPPYSPRQVKECYDGFGMEITRDDTRASFWSLHKDEISRIVRPNGKVISFGWNSMGMGKCRGFRITHILLVPHGGSKNDTIVTVSIKNS